jgi:DNA-binding Lrp family transcriptional regulator
MDGETVKLGYRELAERLGISPDAARMKAKRAAKSGRWRIIPGNHPSDRVIVELPTDDLNGYERVAGVRRETVSRGTRGRTIDQTDTNGITGQMVAALQSAQDRIRELTDHLTDEKDRHRETAIAMAQAEAGQANAASEIDRLESLIAELQTSRRSLWERIMRR